MAQYNYDENGATFNYFLLAMLSILLVPSTYSMLFGGPKKSSSKKGGCDCEGCLKKNVRLVQKAKKNTPLVTPRAILFVIGWAAFTFVSYKVATTSLESGGSWDPYEIIGGINMMSTEQAIKSRYRKLARTSHPDKAPEDATKEGKDLFEKKWIEINKAYKVLTDSEARKIFDEYGNPDGPAAMTLGIALPKWLVKDGYTAWVLVVYALIFGCGLPYIVHRWWSQAKNMTKDKILHTTMALFYRELKETIPINFVVDLLASASEYKEIVSLEKSSAYNALEAEVKKRIELTGDRFERVKRYSTAAPWSQKASVFLHSQIFRIPIHDPELKAEQEAVVVKAPHLLGGLLQISLSRNWLHTSLNIIDFGQCIIQALPLQEQSAYMSQLPLTPEILKNFHSKKHDITLIRHFLALEEDEQKTILCDLDTQKFKTVLSAAREYPSIRLATANFAVVGEENITPGSIVTLTVRVDLLTVEQLRDERKNGSKEMDVKPEADEPPKPEWWTDSKKDLVVSAHAPYFPLDKKPIWWVMLGDAKQNKLITVGRITDLSVDHQGMAKLQFQAPPKPGKLALQVYVKSDSFVACDGSVQAELEVVDGEAMEDIPDDISEPDVDSLAGQMAQSKAQGKSSVSNKPKQQKGEYDDSSESEDDDGPPAVQQSGKGHSGGGGHSCPNC